MNKGRLLALLSIMPEGLAASVCSGPLYMLMRHVVGYRRRVVEKNLGLAFPGLDDKERRVLERRFYRHFSKVLGGILLMERMGAERLREKIEVDFGNVVHDEGIKVCYLAHYGNWEYVIAAIASQGDCDTYYVYSPLHDADLDMRMRRIRERYGLRSVASDDVSALVGTLVRCGTRARLLVLADQLPKERFVRHFHELMGIKSKVITGTESLLRRFGLRAEYCDVEYRGNDRYFCRIEDMDVAGTGSAGSAWPVTDRYFDLLQRTLDRDPALWLWTHDRWRR